MKNISTGFGLCVLGLGIAAWPVLDRLAPSASASAVTAAASAVGAAAAQAGPTIVWYGVSGDAFDQTVIRAWSDGRVEATAGSWRVDQAGQCVVWQSKAPGVSAPWCGSRWAVVADPAQGLTYRSDINFDEKVDGADLGQLLADWGSAPRQDIPPSDCPLALINP
jgi:hypothetical protein